ncbi:hypothetical protein [Arthrobacter sp. Z4-13]
MLAIEGAGRVRLSQASVRLPEAGIQAGNGYLECDDCAGVQAFATDHHPGPQGPDDESPGGWE